MCCREDIEAEDFTIDSIYGRSICDMNAAYIFDSFISRQQSPHDDYIGCLYEFSRRKISLDWEIRNASAGISKLPAARLDALMYYGLPNSLFDWALLWEPSQELRRRPEFPSWSWAGWAGWAGGVGKPVGSLANLSSKELQNWPTMIRGLYGRGKRRVNLVPV